MEKIVFAILILNSLRFTSFAQSPPSQAAGYILSFSDNFATNDVCTAFTSACNWYTPGNYQYAAGGAITNPSGTYENLQWSKSITGGNFAIIGTAVPRASPVFYRAWTYGYFEVSMLIDAASGSWPAVWLDPVSTIGNSQNNGAELDLFEYQSNSPAYFLGTLHVWVNGVDQAGDCCSSSTNQFPFPAGTNFSLYHSYGVLWTPISITWYFDNVQVGKVKTDVAPYNTVFAGQQALYLIIAQQAGCKWTVKACSGGLTDPQNLRVQWVHVFTLPNAGKQFERQGASRPLGASTYPRKHPT